MCVCGKKNLRKMCGMMIKSSDDDNPSLYLDDCIDGLFFYDLHYNYSNPQLTLTALKTNIHTYTHKHTPRTTTAHVVLP